MDWIIEKERAGIRVRAEITRLGTDYQILLQGGERPHIGCTVLAVPRPSLTGDGRVSSTASVLNVTGHKDEVLCRTLAEQVSAGKEAVVVCSGGVHMDGITAEQIREVTELVQSLAEEIVAGEPEIQKRAAGDRARRRSQNE